METPRAGTEVTIECRMKRSATSIAYDPPQGLFLTLTDPTGTIQLNQQSMTKDSAGVYSTKYQTLEAGPLGRWVVKYRALDGSAVHLSHDMEAFTLVST